MEGGNRDGNPLVHAVAEHLALAFQDADHGEDVVAHTDLAPKGIDRPEQVGLHVLADHADTPGAAHIGVVDEAANLQSKGVDLGIAGSAPEQTNVLQPVVPVGHRAAGARPCGHSFRPFAEFLDILEVFDGDLGTVDVLPPGAVRNDPGPAIDEDGVGAQLA